MPNKTLYVKDSDLPLFERAQQQLGDSISSMFAEFLRERVIIAIPEEGRIMVLIDQISQLRDAIGKERDLPRFLDVLLVEAQGYAEKALKSFRRGEVSKTKIYFYAANAYRDKAERDIKESRELQRKLAEMLKS